MAQSLDYSKIQDSCDSLTNLASSMGDSSENITTAISKIESPAWEGAASTSFRDKITTLADNLPEATRQMAEAVVFLASCADAYDQLDKEAVKKLKDLIGGQDYIDNYDVENAPEIDLNSRYGESDTETDTTTTDTSTDTTTTSGGYTSSSSSSSYSGGARYTYNTITGSTAGVVSTALVSSEETTSSLTDLTSTDMTGKTIEIPDSVSQGSYTVTGYDYWIDSGKEMVWSSSSNQRTVSDIWKEQGSVFKNGIAVINVDGEDRYLVAVTTKFGEPGDCIDVNLADGSTVKCIIGDSKGDGTGSGSEWGHLLSDGSVNVLEFEVQREKYLQSGNPTTEGWDLPWDSSQKVKSITNQGSIIGAKTTDKTVLLKDSESTDTTKTSSDSTTTTDSTTSSDSTSSSSSSSSDSSTASDSSSSSSSSTDSSSTSSSTTSDSTTSVSTDTTGSVAIEPVSADTTTTTTVDTSNTTDSSTLTTDMVQGLIE